MFTVKDYPPHLIIVIRSENGFDTSLFTELDIRKHSEGLLFKFGAVKESRYWKNKWGLSTFFATLHDIIIDSADVKVSHIEIDEDWRGLELDFIIKEDFRFEELLQKIVARIKELMK